MVSHPGGRDSGEDEPPKPQQLQLDLLLLGARVSQGLNEYL